MASNTHPSDIVPPSSPVSSQSKQTSENIPEKTIDSVLSSDMRSFMTTFPSGVGIITAMGIDKHPWGMTCTSICSVTLEPPTLLVCLRRGSPTLEALLASGVFALNLLHENARAVAELFASGAPDRFARVAWHIPITGEGPHLTNAAYMTADCMVDHATTVGSHMVVFGKMYRITQQAEARPLLYGLRCYARWPDCDNNQ